MRDVLPPAHQIPSPIRLLMSSSPLLRFLFKVNSDYNFILGHWIHFLSIMTPKVHSYVVEMLVAWSPCFAVSRTMMIFHRHNLDLAPRVQAFQSQIVKLLGQEAAKQIADLFPLSYFRY
jgi:hypothetical protein